MKGSHDEVILAWVLRSPGCKPADMAAAAVRGTKATLLAFSLLLALTAGTSLVSESILAVTRDGLILHAGANPGCGTITGAEATARIREALEDGIPARLGGCVIAGDLALTPLGSVAEPLLFADARFEGLLDASFVAFNSIVDFSGVDFREAPGFTGAIFDDDLIMADASLGVAGQEATVRMDRVSFKADADFRRATFQNKVSFDDASFGGRALFQSVHFLTDASFSGVAFKGAAVFVNCQCDGPTYVSSTTAIGDLNFEASIFKQNVDFADTVIAGTLSLRSSRIEGQPFFLDDVTAQLVDMRDATFGDKGLINFSEPTLGGLLMDIDAIDRIDGSKQDEERIAALRLIESTYREEGDLSKANAAAYQRQEIADGHLGQPERSFRMVFFRWIGGYSVQPINPLVTILLLVLAAWTVRAFWDSGWGRKQRTRCAMRFFGESGAPPEEEDTRRWQARTADAFARAAHVPVALKPGALIEKRRGSSLLPTLWLELWLLNTWLTKL